jgi:DNA polymerase
MPLSEGAAADTAEAAEGVADMQTWDELEQSCLSCSRCGLCQTRTNVVFGVGREDADILFVGEGPGEQEDLKGEPFVGAAGHLLDDMLSIIDLDRRNCYIANIVKCRPPGNRDPLDEEQNACIGFLRAQVALIQPKIIVCLGRVAAKRLIDPDYRITKEHGTWICRKGIWMTAIYHPSALLRDTSKRPDTFEDLLDIRNKIREVHANV